MKTELAIQRLTDAVENGFMQTQESMHRLDETISRHNGRLTTVEKWKQRIEGGRTILKGLWTVFGIFFIAGIFGLFRMYSELNRVIVNINTIEERNQQTIENKINERLSSYFEVRND